MASATSRAPGPDSGGKRALTFTFDLTPEEAAYFVSRALRRDLPEWLTADDIARLLGRTGVPLTRSGVRKKLARLGVPVAHVGAEGGPLVRRDDLYDAIDRSRRPARAGEEQRP